MKDDRDDIIERVYEVFDEYHGETPEDLDAVLERVGDQIAGGSEDDSVIACAIRARDTGDYGELRSRSRGYGG